MKRNVKTIFLVLVAISVFAFMMPNMAASADTIKVGIVLPVTGPQAKFGEIEKQSFDMALAEINGALADDPITRPEQGEPDEREAVQ